MTIWTKKEKSLILAVGSLILAVGSLLILLGTVAQVSANDGSVRLTVQGYGTIHGQLTDPNIQENGTISLVMQVNDQLMTGQGAFPITATGVWVGTIDGSSVGGEIRNVAGVVHVCVVMCQDANFVGTGQWSGQLNGSNATGDFEGTITFTNSPAPQITAGQPIPVSGTWTDTFQLPMAELGFGTWALTLVLAVGAALLVSHKVRWDTHPRTW